MRLCSLNITSGSRVPVEFTGKTRTFCVRIDQGDTIAIGIIHRTSRAPTARMARATRCRDRRSLPALPGSWRAPSFDLDIVQARKALHIVERRCRRTIYATRRGAMSASPLLASCVSRSASCPLSAFPLSCVTLVGISMHPLERRYERKPGAIGDDVVIADIVALVNSYERLVAEDEGTEFSVDIGDGKWLGSVLDVLTGDEEQRVVSVRTFVEA